MSRLSLPIVVEIDEDGVYVVSCPMFKGCHSYGATVDEAMENLREVIDMCLKDEEVTNLNQFVGFREIEVTIP